AEAFRGALEHPPAGMVGLVNDLLRLCPPEGLILDWQGDGCRVRLRTGTSAEWFAGPLRKSVFRALLARVVVLCNERSPNSLSPYGGQGELQSGTNPATVFQVTLTNTSGEQRLELVPVRPEAVDRIGPAEHESPTAPR